MKKNMLAAGALLGSTLVLSGCQLDLSLGGGEEAVSSYDVTDTVSALDISSGAGEIVINESSRSGIRVTETIHWRNEKPATEHPVDAEHAHPPEQVRVVLLGGLQGRDPEGCRGQAGHRLGHRHAARADRGVSAATGSGNIEANALGAKQFVAAVGSGDIQAKFAVMPDKVDLETGSGDVTARLPQGAYNVTTRTGSGSQTVEVTKDPSAPRTVSVQTGSGDAEVLLG
ncbi:DUF4097 family beta strand repeat-containing protein [Streptosporangium lutulentum]